MKKTLLIIFPTEFYEDRVNLYELNTFILHGYEIIVHELTCIIYEGYKQRQRKEIPNISIKKFQTLHEWSCQIEKLNSIKSIKLLIFDFLFPYYGFRRGVLYKQMKNLNGKKICFINPGDGIIKYKKTYNISNKLKLYFYIGRSNLYYLKAFTFLHTYRFKHDKILIGSKNISTLLYISNKLFNLNIINGHSWIFSNFIHYKVVSTSFSYRYNLLLDSASPTKDNDVFYLKINNLLTKEKWYPALKSFFDFVEKKTSNPFVIKSHPSVVHPEFPDYYGGRKVSYGITSSLVKNSECVFTIHSSAVGYALIHLKPTILITNNQLIRMESNLYQKFLSEYLSLPIVNLDNDFNKINLKDLTVDHEQYQKYIKLFLTIGDREQSNSKLILSD